MKLHELTPEKVGLAPVEPPPPDIKGPKAIDPLNPTQEQALAALKSAYKVLVGTAPFDRKALANRLITPAILYVENSTK